MSSSVTDPAELARLAALPAYAVLDTPADPTLDKITAMAAELFDTPVAAITLVDADRVWCKSRWGEAPVETPRRDALCDRTIQQPRQYECECRYQKQLSHT